MTRAADRLPHGSVCGVISSQRAGRHLEEERRSEDGTMWHWFAFQTALAGASWLAWPIVVANAPLAWLRIWVPPQMPVRLPKSE